MIIIIGWLNVCDPLGTLFIIMTMAATFLSLWLFILSLIELSLLCYCFRFALLLTDVVVVRFSSLLLHQPLYVWSIDLILYYIPIYTCRGCIEFAFLLYSCHHLVAIIVAIIDDNLSMYGALSIVADGSDGSGTPSTSSTVTFCNTVTAIASSLLLLLLLLLQLIYSST